jgi:hypothetical protein
MTWRRLTRAEAQREALADYRERVRDEIESGRLLRELLAQDDARRAAALDATRPVLREMTSAQLLDMLHGYYRRSEFPLPCDERDLFETLLDEIERRRSATAHERIRLRELDRRG